MLTVMRCLYSVLSARKRDVVPELCLNLNGSKCLVTTAVHLHGGKEPKWGKNPADCLFCALQVPFLPILSPHCVSGDVLGERHKVHLVADQELTVTHARPSGCTLQDPDGQSRSQQLTLVQNSTAVYHKTLEGVFPKMEHT